MKVGGCALIKRGNEFFLLLPAFLCTVQIEINTKSIREGHLVVGESETPFLCDSLPAQLPPFPNHSIQQLNRILQLLRGQMRIALRHCQRFVAQQFL